MSEWILARGEILPGIFLMAGLALIAFCLVSLLLDNFPANTGAPRPSADSRSETPDHDLGARRAGTAKPDHHPDAREAPIPRPDKAASRESIATVRP